MKKNYVIMNATVYEETNERGAYHWVVGDLFYYENPNENPQRLPRTTIIREEEAKKFLKCSTEMSAQERQLRQIPANRKAYIFDYAAALKAFNEEKFADGTPCGYEFVNPLTKETIKQKDAFFVQQNVEKFTETLLRPVCQIATRPTTVKLLDGTTRQIAAGQPIVGKNGAIMPITKIDIYCKVDAEDNPIEDLEQMKNRLLEGHYKFMDETPQGAPGAAPAQTQPAGQTPEQAQTQQAAAAAAAALGSGVTPF